MAVAASLHADDYELVTPGGAALSKQDYLTGIESGELDYHVFEAASDVAVRVSGEVGIVRYQARIDIAVSGRADQDSSGTPISTSGATDAGKPYGRKPPESLADLSRGGVANRRGAAILTVITSRLRSWLRGCK